ncbi:hypothetical protein QVD99_006740 [Batrachochytrium dendrobatidis]|nr:hypothetical protein QVD99_006740 [Batrachochytrium dendrobatidis]
MNESTAGQSFKFVQRPKSTDDEHDLVRMQDEFKSVSGQSAATAIRSKPPAVRSASNSKTPVIAPDHEDTAELKPLQSEKKSVSWDSALDQIPELDSAPISTPEILVSDNKPVKKMSLFAQRRIAKLAAATESTTPVDHKSVHRDVVNSDFQHDSTSNPNQKHYPKSYIESTDALFGSVLKNVTERDLDFNAQADQHAFDMKPIYKDGFPTSVHRSIRAVTKSSAAPDLVSDRDTPNAADMPDYAQENIRKIDMMSAEEIADAQQEIASKLDPAILSFLMSRKPTPLTNDVAVSSNEDAKTKATTPLERSNENHTFSHIDQFIDPSTAQPEKLEWMLDLEEQSSIHLENSNLASAEKELYRFDFQGTILTQLTPTSTVDNSALFHHGDDPSLPGYSIKELVYLSKSTVPAQRAMSLQLISRIITNIYEEQYSSKDLAAIIKLFKKNDVLLHIRVAVDASHETVVFQAIETLAQYFGASSIFSESEYTSEFIWSRLSLARVGYRTISLSPKSIALFAAKSRGKDTVDFELPEKNDSLASISKLISIDAVSGLQETNILVRMRYLLKNTSSPTRFAIDIVDILTVMARHSAISAQDILECAGLVDAIAQNVFKLKWPLSDTSIVELTLIRNTLRLFRILCQSGRDATVALIKHNLITATMRYLTLLPSNFEIAGKNYGVGLKLDIATQVWLLQGVVFSYTLGGRVFDDYRSLMMECAEKCSLLCLRFTSSPVLSESQTDTHDVLKIRMASLSALTSICRVLQTLLMRYRSEMNAGGENDALLPFVTLVVNVLESVCHSPVPEHHTHSSFTDTIARAAFISAALDLLNDYVSKSITYQFQAGSEIMTIFCKVEQLIPQIKDCVFSPSTIAFFAKYAESNIDFPLFGLKSELGIPFCQLSARRRATQLTDLTALCNAAAALLDTSQLVKRHIFPNELSADSILFSPLCMKLIHFLTEEFDTLLLYDHESWIRVFGQGRPNMLLTWTKGVSVLARKCTERTPTIELAIKAAVVASAVGIPELLPGDEYIAADWLNGSMFSHKFSPMEKPDTALSRIFSLELFTDSTLLQSQALYRADDRIVLRSLFFESLNGTGSLPIRRDWIFGPLDRLYHEFKTHGLSSVPADVIDIVKHVLGFFKDMSEHNCLTTIAPSAIITHMMKVFLLSDDNGNEVFHDHDIAFILDWAFNTYAKSVCMPSHASSKVRSSAEMNSETSQATALPPLELAMNGGTVFFQLYQDLLNQFVAVSFGALHLQKYLILPLTMAYPRDYHMAFWTTLDHSLLERFSLSIQMLKDCGVCLNEFVQPAEQDQDMLACYRSALPCLRVDSFLAYVADAHVNHAALQVE